MHCRKACTVATKKKIARAKEINKMYFEDHYAASDGMNIQRLTLSLPVEIFGPRSGQMADLDPN